MVQFTINGDGFSNETVVIIPSEGSGQATYATADDATVGECTSADGKYFTIAFKGNTTGTLQYDSDMSEQVGFAMTLDTMGYMSYEGTVLIEEYGAVGGWVRGSFDGTVVRFFSSPEAYATISNSSFLLKRMPDQ